MGAGRYLPFPKSRRGSFVDQSQLSWTASFIWGIAEDVPLSRYVRGKSRDVILPMPVLRRLDSIPDVRKSSALSMKAALGNVLIESQDAPLRQAAGHAFYHLAAYIGVLTNRKPPHWREKVQLIDATTWHKPLRNNLGKKNCHCHGQEAAERLPNQIAQPDSLVESDASADIRAEPADIPDSVAGSTEP